jgi:hypothetical protein
MKKISCWGYQGKRKKLVSSFNFTFRLSMMSFHQAIPSLVNVNRNVVSCVRMTKDGTSAYKLCSVRLYFQLFVGGHIFIYIVCVSFPYSDAQHILCCVFLRLVQYLWIVHF